VKVAYFDCTFGAAGDMLVASLLAAGADLDYLQQMLATLPLPVDAFHIQSNLVFRANIQATRFAVSLAGDHKDHDHHHHHDHRPLSQILTMIEASKIEPRAKELAKAIFIRLGQAEAKVHEAHVDEVHFHEVGAVDAIVDIVGFAVAYCALGIDRAYANGLPSGSGLVDCAHGRFVAPVPAVVNLMMDAGCPVLSTPIDFECTTPTGAAIIAEIVQGYGRMPEMTRMLATGYGAGGKNPPGHPNVVRVMLGEQADIGISAEHKPQDQGLEHEVICIEANLDDCSPQIIAHSIDGLLAIGALDAAVYPATMKKGRPGHKLSVLAMPQDRQRIEQYILSQTTTLGVRAFACTRTTLKREWRDIQLDDLGMVRVKIGYLADGKVASIQPEYDDIVEIADRSNLPLKQLIDRATQIASKILIVPVVTMILTLGFCSMATKPAQAQATPNLAGLVERSHILHNGAYVQVETAGKRAQVDVFRFHPQDNVSRSRAAISIAKSIVNYAPAQYYLIAVRFHWEAQSLPYREFIVPVRDITSLNAGSISLEQLSAALSNVEAGVADTPWMVAERYLSVAHQYVAQGKYWEADMIISALDVGANAPESCAERYTASLIALSRGYDSWGDPDKAQNALSRALAYCQSRGGMSQPQSVRVVQSMTEMLIAANKLDQAQTQLKAILERPEIANGQDEQAQIARANYLELLARVHLKAGLYDEAESELKQVLELNDKAHVDKNMRGANSFELLGDVYKMKGEGRGAREYYGRAKSIFEKALLNKDHTERIDYGMYAARVKQIDDKLRAVN